jgi:two-component system KDP operon response regulator KdpE
MLPVMSGFEVCRILRRETASPILMLTAKTDEVDKVVGLELGADDYVTKPFSPRELAQRVRAVLRRTETPAPVEKSILRIDDYLQIDFNRRIVIAGGKEVKLRPTEYRLLYHLINNPGWVLTHEQLLSKVWGYEYRQESQYLRLYVTYLRQKIEPDPAHPRYILTERGVGYRFVDWKRGGQHADQRPNDS